MASKRRSLTPEEKTLWETVARTARPLRPERNYQPFKPAKTPNPSQEPTAPNPVATEAPKPRPRHPAAPIDRRTARRLARGSITLDGRIDLHGDDQSKAYDRLYRYLMESQTEGRRIVLVITGKGVFGEGERGVLRRSLPHWLNSPRFRPLAGGFEQAHRTHGGAGAFYVRVRRPVGDR